MQIGLQIPSFKYPGGTAAIRPKLKEIVTTAEEAGFYSLWVMDHYYQIKGLFGEAYTDPMMESYTTLGYFAGLTEKAWLGVLVTGVIYRHPSVLMKMVNTLDILSGGRAYLGIGAAWYEEEAKGFGIPYPSTSERFEQLEDNLQLAKALWDGDQVSFKGQHFSAPAITNNPRPLSNPHPRIMIGGMGPKKTLRMVAQYADACNFFEGAGKPAMQSASTHSKPIATSWDVITRPSRKHPSAPCTFPRRIPLMASSVASRHSQKWALPIQSSTCLMSTRSRHSKPLPKRSSPQWQNCK